MAPKTEKQFQHSARIQLRGLHEQAAKYGRTVARRTAARKRALAKALHTSGFRRISLKRSEKHGVWTVKMQIDPKFVGSNSYQVRISIQKTLQSLGYAADRGAVYAVTLNKPRVCAGFVLIKP